MLNKFIYILLLVFPLLAFTQDFNYVNYNTKDGLAGSTVYDMCQDKDGFIWFATENGLSRYDGTHFKNFTVKDGLPDNEVLKVFADSKGRVWIGTFSKDLCFYLSGKMHTKENDSLVKKLTTNKSVEAIVEDDGNYLGFSFRTSVLIVTPADSVLNYKLGDITNQKSKGVLMVNYLGRILLSVSDVGFFEFNHAMLNWEVKNRFYQGILPPNTESEYSFYSIEIDSISNKRKGIFFPANHLSSEVSGSYHAYINTTNGTWAIDTINFKLAYHYLPNYKITRTVIDKEGELWFSSMGDGVFKLPSQKVKTLFFKSNHTNNQKEIFSIASFKNGVLAGGEFSKGIYVNNKLETSELNYANNQNYTTILSGANRLFCIKKISNSVSILGFDVFLVKLENDKPQFNYTYTTKSIDKIDDNNILLGTSFGAFKMRIKDLKITDTIWRERCTKVFYLNNDYYIGTLKGLYQVKEDKSYKYLGELNPVLARRITDIKSSMDGTLWVSTSDNGVVAIKNDKIKRVINDSLGLSSNICKSLFVNGNDLWVGTDKGVNKIDIINPQTPIIKYSTSDGLPSNTINAIYVKDSLVWVGSPEGLTYFNENSISSTSMCNLKMLNISISEKKLELDSVYNLSYNNNNISFEFVGISFRSGGEITYHYKLTGLDNKWQTTSENILDYKSLPSGKYKLQLYGVNKYGVKSNEIVIDIIVETPFWKSLWLYVLVGIVFLSGLIWVLKYRNKKAIKKLEQKNAFQKQFAALEQQALQSQMNPHFIFNCLNSIQQYILTNEKEKANLYLSGFAGLIRQTLDISSKESISVSEEASYLKKYLEMEQMRFGDSFSYEINISENVNAEFLKMPALLLQPFVENSLRHGIRYKEDGIGKVEINFSLVEDKLFCTIKDNGVGRDMAASYKSKQHIEYQSKGMSLTSKRIALLNNINQKEISVEVKDLKNEDDTAAGTLVEIKIPI